MPLVGTPFWQLDLQFDRASKYSDWCPGASGCSSPLPSKRGGNGTKGWLPRNGCPDREMRRPESPRTASGNVVQPWPGANDSRTGRSEEPTQRGEESPTERRPAAPISATANAAFPAAFAGYRSSSRVSRQLSGRNTSGRPSIILHRNLGEMGLTSIHERFTGPGHHVHKTR